MSRPVKLSEKEDFQTDPLLLESMRSEFERGSFSAIAAEQVSRPDIVRNKNIKTMTQLIGQTDET